MLVVREIQDPYCIWQMLSLYPADVVTYCIWQMSRYPADVVTYCIRQIFSLTVSGRYCNLLYPADILSGRCHLLYPADVVTVSDRCRHLLYLADVATQCIWQMSLTVSGRCHLPMLFPRACWLSVKSTTLTRKASRQTVTFVK